MEGSDSDASMEDATPQHQRNPVQEPRTLEPIPFSASNAYLPGTVLVCHTEDNNLPEMDGTYIRHIGVIVGKPSKQGRPYNKENFLTKTIGFQKTWRDNNFANLKRLLDEHGIKYRKDDTAGVLWSRLEPVINANQLWTKPDLYTLDFGMAYGEPGSGLHYRFTKSTLEDYFHFLQKPEQFIEKKPLNLGGQIRPQSLEWFWTPREEGIDVQFRLLPEYSRYNRLVTCMWRNTRDMQAEGRQAKKGAKDYWSHADKDELRNNVLALGSSLFCSLAVATSKWIDFDFGRVSSLRRLQGLLAHSMDRCTDMYPQHMHRVFEGKEDVFLKQGKNNLNNDVQESQAAWPDEQDKWLHYHEDTFEHYPEEYDDDGHRILPERPYKLPHAENITFAVSGRGALPRRSYFHLGKLEITCLNPKDARTGKHDDIDKDSWQFLPFFDAAQNEQMVDPLWQPGRDWWTFKQYEETLAEGSYTDDPVPRQISNWFDLDPERDTITRFLATQRREKGKKRNPQWAFIGIYAHQNCYTRSLLRTVYSESTFDASFDAELTHNTDAICWNPAWDMTPKTQWLRKAIQMRNDARMPYFDDPNYLDSAALQENMELRGIQGQQRQRQFKKYMQMIFKWHEDHSRQLKNTVSSKEDLSNQDPNEHGINTVVLPPGQTIGNATRLQHWDKLYTAGADAWFEAGAPYDSLSHQFTENLRAILQRLAHSLKWKLPHAPGTGATFYGHVDVAPEFSIYWPYGLFTLKDANNLDSFSKSMGRGYHTMIDLVSYAEEDNEGSRSKVIIVEYKTRMELSQNSNNIFSLRNDKGARLQARLNAWMFYLSTGVMPTDVYIVQATRRVKPGHYQEEINTKLRHRQLLQEAIQVALQTETKAGDDGDARLKKLHMGVVARWKADPEERWADKSMVELITRFALNRFQSRQNDTTRYVDSKFLVPDVKNLMKLLGYQEEAASFNGQHPFFYNTLCSSDFTLAVNKAYRAPSDAAQEDNPDVILMKLPKFCAIKNRGDDAHCAVLLPTFWHANFRDTIQPFDKVNLQYSNFTTLKNEMFYDSKASHDADREYLKKLYPELMPGEFVMKHDDSPDLEPIFIPLLFDSKDKFPVLFINVNTAHTKLVIKEMEAEMPRPAQAAIPFFGKHIFRPTATVQFDRRVYPKSEQDFSAAALAECNFERLKLNKMVLDAAKALHDRIEKIKAVADYDLKQFFTHTIEDIYRKNLITEDAPQIREFPHHRYPDGSLAHYAPMPVVPEKPANASAKKKYNQACEKFRLVCIIRCLNRLINMRLLRGVMTMMGIQTVDPDVLENNMLYDPQKNWHTSSQRGDRLKSNFHRWHEKETNELKKLLGPHDYPDNDKQFWETKHPDQHNSTSAELFPHLSQRALWTNQATLALTIAIKTANRSESIVQLCADQIFEDMREVLP